MTDPMTDRRSTPLEMLELIRTIHGNQVELSKSLTNHMETETHELAVSISKLIAEAFPAGDPGGHRRHHELVIKAAEEKAEFWQKMRVALAQYGLLGFAGWLFFLIWQGILQGPHK